MLRLSFTSTEIDQLHQERTTHPHPRVRQRMEVLYLKALEYPHQEICHITRISPTTLRSYLKQYQAGGIEALKELNFYQPESELTAHEVTIRCAFEEKPPQSLKEAVARIHHRAC